MPTAHPLRAILAGAPSHTVPIVRHQYDSLIECVDPGLVAKYKVLTPQVVVST